MPNVMAERCHTQNSPPVAEPQFIGDDGRYPRIEIIPPHHGIVDARRQFHHAEGVLEAPVCGSWIDQIGGCKLVDVP